MGPLTNANLHNYRPANCPNIVGTVPQNDSTFNLSSILIEIFFLVFHPPYLIMGHIVWQRSNPCEDMSAQEERRVGSDTSMVSFSQYYGVKH